MYISEVRHNRGRFDIASEILEVANGGKGRATKTMIMYAACLTDIQLNRYLTTLTENDLLDCDVDTQTFKTTEKGIRFLETYNQIDAVVKKPSTELTLEEKTRITKTIPAYSIEVI